jgi:hypothetical protein
MEAATTQGLREGLMKIRQAVVPALLGLFLAGCRSDPSRDLLERDNFHKEQEIYQLKGQVEDLERQLSAATAPQSSQPAYTRPTAPGEMPPDLGSTENSRPGRPATRPGPALLPPSRQPEESPGLEPLRIVPGAESPAGELPNTFRRPAGTTPGPTTSPSGAMLWRPSDVRLASGVGDCPDFSADTGVPVRGSLGEKNGTVPFAAVDSQPVAQITLHPSLTGGIGNGAGGDEGLLVVVEPRDFAGNIVPASGETSVALIDPALFGEQARLARWDFTAAQTERMLHTGAEPGIHLRLMWRSSPAHDRLKVFVRYTTRDGRKLQAERIIAVATGARGMRPETEVGPWSSDRAEDGARSPDRSSDLRQAAPQRPQWSPDRD